MCPDLGTTAAAQQLKKLGVNPEKGRLKPWNVCLRCLKPGLRGRAGPSAGIIRRQDPPQKPGQLCSVTWISQAVSGGRALSIPGEEQSGEAAPARNVGPRCLGGYGWGWRGVPRPSAGRAGKVSRSPDRLTCNRPQTQGLGARPDHRAGGQRPGLGKVELGVGWGGVGVQASRVGRQAGDGAPRGGP